MNTSTLILTPAVAALDHQARSMEVLVRLSTPARVDIAPRPTLNLSLVIDASTSMQGRPLAYALDAARAFIRQLTATDRVSIHAYGSEVYTVLTSMPAHQAQELVDEALGKIHAFGMTALHAGWMTGAQAVAPYVGSYGISRVLLLSDGVANIGKKDPEVFQQEAQRLYSEGGISTSTYGLGLNFNETLMTVLAVGGLACYAESAEELTPYFATEFQVMEQTCGQDLRLHITAQDPQGTPLSVEVLNVLSSDPQGWKKLGPVVAGVDAWMVVEVACTGQEGNITLTAEAMWTTPSGREVLRSTHLVPISDVSGSVDELVVERAKEARAARLQLDARTRIQHNDLSGAQHAINQMQAMAGQNAYIKGVAHTLNACMSTGNLEGFRKEAMYSAHTMSTRSMSVHEGLGVVGTSSTDARKIHQGRAVHTPEWQAVPSAPPIAPDHQKAPRRRGLRPTP